MKYILIIITILSFYSCQKDSSQKDKKSKETIKKNIVVKKDLRTLITEENFKGNKYTFNNLSIIIPNTFKKKNEALFFEENGTNLSFAKDKLNTSVHDYIERNFDILKNDFFNIIKEEEKVLINEKIVRYVKYIIDRKKFFIQIESILINYEGEIYIVTISGKKKHINVLSKTINNMFSTIKLNKEKENIVDQ